MLEHYTLVAPELEKRNLRGTFWINGNSVGMANTEDGGRVSWNQLREMEERGQEIGNHTWSHPNCRKVGLDAFMYDVWRNDSSFMENLGHRPLTLAYPYNAMTEDVVASVDSGRIGSRTFQTGHGQQNSKSTLEKMTSWMHELMDRGEWGVTMTHGINKGYDKWDKAGFLIDPGAQAGFIYDTIVRNGWKIEKILLTHGHFDHFGAAELLREELVAPIYIYTSDAMYLTDPYVSSRAGSDQSSRRKPLSAGAVDPK